MTKRGNAGRASHAKDFVAVCLGTIVLVQGILNLGRGSYGPYVLISLGVVAIIGAALSFSGLTLRNPR